MKKITVHFVSSDDENTLSVQASEGDNLLTVAQIHDQPLEGTCEGQMACSTCHVIVE
ncbi:MAG: 2Fe-2S iron-sulfur cluster binding domain-containing protein, partial [Sphingomonadales bacterium]|nr:2Fe-2S iron-sulfur cluster binding domain-containing protein [Sphingomonadales bacterium]